jgi:sugar phosphate isomerase/epimerase
MGGLMIGGKGIAGTLDYISNSETPATPPAKELGLQIYSLQRELYDNPAQRMKELREMGYVNLELAGYRQGQIGGVDMMEFKKMADDAGLKIVSSHVSPEGARTFSREILPAVREFWKETADNHAKLGCKYLVQPSMPNVATHDDAALACEFFNEAGKISKAAGLQWGYHNHNGEFLVRAVKPEDADKPSNPRRPLGDMMMDLFIAGTDPSLVMFELDVYWTVRGAMDPLDYMKNHADRIKALHIKDTAVLGQSGLLNFENIFNQMYANGIRDWYVELEGVRGTMTQTEGVKACADYLLKMPFVR